MPQIARIFFAVIIFIQGSANAQRDINPDAEFIVDETPVVASAGSLADDNLIEISQDKWNEIDQALTLEDLSHLLGIEEENASVSSIAALQEDNFLRSASAPSHERYIANPSLSICTPEVVSVELPLPKSARISHYPKCARVQRCGGCCSSNSQICRPTHSRKVFVKVIKLTTMSLPSANYARRRRTRGNSRRQRGTDSVVHETLNVTITEHTKCSCMCRITESDCNLLLQEYNPHTCSCNCKNRDKRDKCSNDPLRYWSEETCSCKCRESHLTSCSTGQVFDSVTCKCERAPAAVEDSSFTSFLRRTQESFQDRLDQLRPSIFGGE